MVKWLSQRTLNPPVLSSTLNGPTKLYNKNNHMKIKRNFDILKPVMVYRNLQKDCWSIKQNGLVVAYSDELTLKEVTFKVSETGRQKVIKTKHKNVHAFVCGTITYTQLLVLPNLAYYNPYATQFFIDYETKDELKSAAYCRLTADKMVKYQ